MTTVTQRTFSSGEISPSLYARVDLVRYATGLRTCLNNIVLRYGGVSNRPGTIFLDETREVGTGIRLIPFEFNANQTYVLEFGNLYMRVMKQGQVVYNTPLTITAITQANPGEVTTSAPHGLSSGDEVFISGVVGMTQINNRTFRIVVVGASTFTLRDRDNTTDIDTTTFSAYVSGGTASQPFTLVTPYAAVDLPTLNFTQSADVVTLVHPTYAPRELRRLSDTNWSLVVLEFKPQISPPANLTGSAGLGTAVNYEYKVTAIDAETGEESFAAIRSSASKTITNITNASPAVVTAVGHGFSSDREHFISGVSGMIEVNDRSYFILVLTADTFSLRDVDSTNFNVYTSGGTATPSFVGVTSDVPTPADPNSLTWTAVSGAAEYNVYRSNGGSFGLIGITAALTFKDDGETDPDVTKTPPFGRNPFLGTGNFPGVVSYIQQRLAFGSTTNAPEKVFLSRTGAFQNFTRSFPSQDDDAITFSLAGQRVNRVQGLLDLGRFIMLTSGGEWSAEGDAAGVIRPTDINTKQYSYNGSGDLRPIVIDGVAVYQQARGSIIRDLGYDFEVDGYRGNDLTIFSAHLFDKFTLVDWAFQQTPHSVLWVVRSDGALLGMTFVRNQEVRAWHRHDLGGFVENVAVVPEGNEDKLYVTVKRTINNKTRRCVEQLNTRQILDIRDAVFMDSALSFDGRNTTATTMTLSGGTTWGFTETLTLTSSASFFVAGDVGNQIFLTGASGNVIRFTIQGFSSDTVVTGKPQKTVPVELRGVAVTVWTKAVDRLAGLWHLEGENVSVFADGFVVASPNNDSYDTVTVANGEITLDKPYGVIHVGLPYISDLETLDIDRPNGETLSDKEKLVSEVTFFVEETRGLWSGPKPPSDNSVDPLEGLNELKIRSTEDYDEPVRLATDVVNVKIQPEWNSNGRVFVRQVDPLPISILAINPAGKIPFI